MVKYIKQIFWLIALLNLCLLYAQIKCEQKQWEVVDIPFKTSTYINIGNSVMFGAVFIHENGSMLNSAGFYNGNNEYVLRFSHSLKGLWTFITYSHIDELHGIEGSIKIIGNNNPFTHGGVKIANNNPQKLMYEDGTPYFALAFEIDWLFALDAGNQKDIPNTRNIIREIKSNGFNQVIMNVYAYDVKWQKNIMLPGTDFSKPQVFPFKGTNEYPDFSELNYDFFKHLDRIIHYLNDQCIIAHLMIYVWNKAVYWPEPESVADNLFFDHVIKRYQAFPNIIWDVSKEALSYGRDDMDYITERIERIRKLDNYKRIITVHDYKYCKEHPEKVDIISVQDHWPEIHGKMLAIASENKNKPVFNVEHGGYEKTTHENFMGTYSDPEVCLARTYKCIFAGVYSTYYWQNTAWHEVITRPFDLPSDQQPHFHYYKHLASLFEKYHFNNLTPHLMDQSTYCLTDHDSIWLFYIPAGLNRISGEADILVDKKVKWTLFDPFTGEFFEQNIRKYKDKWITYIRPENFTNKTLVGILEIIDR